MSLNRAKTILICAFLGLNLFLCYHLFGGEIRKLAPVAVSAGEMRDAERRIAEYGYVLEAKVDRAMRKSTFLTVSPSREVEETLRKHFAATAAPAARSGEVRMYEGEGARIRINPGGLIRVDLIPGKELLEDGASAEERDLVLAFEHFLQDSGLALPAARFDFLERSGEKTLLHYVQIFEGRPLYSGYLEAILENNTLKAIDIYLLEPETPPQEREMEVIPATEALLRLMEVLGPSPQIRRIIKAELGFYSREYDAEEWEVPPVWRFLFENGEGCFINAFTGNLELETSK